jgi:hypothetical protein
VFLKIIINKRSIFMNDKVKLHNVFSPMLNLKELDTVVFVYWYRAEKTRDGFQYGEIIKGYNDMTPEDKSLYESCINELFTTNEFYALRDFLGLEVSEPIYSNGINLSQPISEQNYCGPYTNSSADSTIFLNMLENYNLPFEVRGHFNPDLGIPIVKYSTAYDFMKPAKK